MRRLRGRQKIGKIGDCWVCNERPAHGQNTYECGYVQNAWNIVSKNSRYLQRLVDSMPTRLQDDRDKRKID